MIITNKLKMHLRVPTFKKKKREFLPLNEKNKDVPFTEITVGDLTIKRTKHTKLLGVKIEESQECLYWRYLHRFFGPGLTHIFLMSFAMLK